MNDIRLNGAKKNLVKVYVNDDEEFVYINPEDVTFMERFADFIKWATGKEHELSETAAALDKKYEGKPITWEDAEGETQFDTEQLVEMARLEVGTCNEFVEKLESLFGNGVMRKYLKPFYQLNPDFVPDMECIHDFLDEITPAIEQIYKQRSERISSRYDKKKRSGARK